MDRHNFRKSLERYRDNTITRNRLKERFITGRLYAHLKHEELKAQVQQIHDKENAISSSGLENLKASELTKLKGEKGVFFEKMEYDDTYKLPYGVGYDHVIKKKTDLINKQKTWNNRVMDELVEKLGYIDYRDALACNKYILDTKRHGDYHQQARAKVLSIALAKYNAQKREEIER